MDPVTVMAVARGLTDFVPGLVRWIGGDKAGDVADKAVAVAREVTGAERPEDALTAIQQNPELQIKLQQAMAPIIVAEYEAETVRLQEIHQTYRGDVLSDDEYVRRWRPYWGYMTAKAWVIQICTLLLVVVGAVIAAMRGEDEAVIALLQGAGAVVSALTIQWGFALTVLGVAVNKRSHDKQVACGQQPTLGIFGALAERLLGRASSSKTTG